jgi:hypothetical protein
MGKFQEALQRATYPYRLLSRKTTPKDKELQEKDTTSALDFFMSMSKPYRMGANILAQGYGPVFRSLIGEDAATPGAVESFVREALRPEEQGELDRGPYLSALKSGVGIGSSFMPFASRAVPAVGLGARTAQLAGRGALEGMAGGFGYSREGKELQDTALGGALGVGGELIGNYAFDPKYRGMVNEGYANLADGGPGKYSAALRLRDGTMLDDNLEVLRKSAFESIGEDGAQSKMTDMTRARPLDALQDDIEMLSNATHTQAGKKYLEALDAQFGDELGGAVKMPLRLYEPQGIDDMLLQEARKYKTADELSKQLSDITKERESLAIIVRDGYDKSTGAFKDEVSFDAFKRMKNLDNETRTLQEKVKILEQSESLNRQKLLDDKIKKIDANIDALPQKEIDAISNEAKNSSTLDEFLGKMRGSSTQYGEYKPKLRSYLRPESVNVGEIKGLNPDTTITVYRGLDTKNVGNKRIKKGDFVTTDYSDALAYTDSPSKVVSIQTKLKNLVAEYPDEVDITNPKNPVSYELIYNPDGKFYKVTDTYLTDLWKKAQSLSKKIDVTATRASAKVTPPASNIDDMLLQEARKYKTAGEFVKAQGEPVFHGTNYANARQIQESGLDPARATSLKANQRNVFLTGDEKYATSYATQKGGDNSFVLSVKKPADTVIEQSTYKKGMKFPDLISKQKIAPEDIVIKGKDGKWYPIKEFNFFTGEPDTFIGKTPVKLQTKFQLTDLWNKAKGLSKK